jgi:hypothetical protein
MTDTYSRKTAPGDSKVIRSSAALPFHHIRLLFLDKTCTLLNGDTPIGCTDQIFQDFLKRCDLQDTNSEYQTTKMISVKLKPTEALSAKSLIVRSIEDPVRMPSSQTSIGLDSVD